MTDDSNLSPDEERDLHNPDIGDGTPETAPWQAPTPGTPSWVPTRKWAVARVTALAAWLTAWIEAGEWNTTLAILLVGLIGEGLTSYLANNQPTPGGVPEA